jgi:hypothetical protein
VDNSKLIKTLVDRSVVCKALENRGYRSAETFVATSALTSSTASHAAS